LRDLDFIAVCGLAGDLMKFFGGKLVREIGMWVYLDGRRNYGCAICGFGFFLVDGFTKKGW